MSRGVSAPRSLSRRPTIHDEIESAVSGESGSSSSGTIVNRLRLTQKLKDPYWDVEYRVGEAVLVYSRWKTWERGFIKDIFKAKHPDSGKDVDGFVIHYIQWRPAKDTVMKDCLMKLTDENMEKAKDENEMEKKAKKNKQKRGRSEDPSAEVSKRKQRATSEFPTFDRPTEQQSTAANARGRPRKTSDVVPSSAKAPVRPTPEPRAPSRSGTRNRQSTGPQTQTPTAVSAAKNKPTIAQNIRGVDGEAAGVEVPPKSAPKGIGMATKTVKKPVASSTAAAKPAKSKLTLGDEVVMVRDGKLLHGRIEAMEQVVRYRISFQDDESEPRWAFEKEIARDGV